MDAQMLVEVELETVTPASSPLADPVAAAKSAGLRYVHDGGRGIKRVKRGKHFRYIDADGRPIRDEDELRRIRSLVIPPAWTNVWICPIANGHIQATGRDVKGRKQYRYHPRWREVRDETKFNKMLEFGAALPVIRAATEKHMALPGLPRDKVLATVVRLLEGTLIRVGNEEYARQNKSYGLTTLRSSHVAIEGSTLRFHFRGKSGVEHNVDLRDRRLARIVKRCQDIPGHELFQYIDEAGERHPIGSADVNDYLRVVSGKDFTAKDFRTWAGTVLASLALGELAESPSITQAKKNVVQAIRAVSERLGNTPTICRKCYVHPAVIEAYMDGRTLRALIEEAAQVEGALLASLRPEEVAVMAFLKERIGEEVKLLDRALERSLARLLKRRKPQVPSLARAGSTGSARPTGATVSIRSTRPTRSTRLTRATRTAA